MQNSASGLPFMLGAAGDGVADGRYAAALGRPLDLAATWADNNAGMVSLPQLQPGGEYADWDKALDIAIGALDAKAGESWAAAATGAYDARWTQSLHALAAARSGKTGTTYIRFAHEMNGDWYPWAVTADQSSDFITAWRRFRTLQLSIFPTAKLVFCVNRESSGYAGNWTDLYPGPGQVDVMGVDYYNHYPCAATSSDFTNDLDATDAGGGPKGLAAHAAFAASVGLPLALPEWSGVADDAGGDSPALIDAMHDYLTEHAGPGPGQVLSAAQFNVRDNGDGKFDLLLDTLMPASATEYRTRFGDVTPGQADSVAMPKGRRSTSGDAAGERP